MHAAVSVLQKCLSSAFTKMHALRAEALLGTVGALLRGRRLILIELARAWPGAERVRAPLKRIDRLLGNRHLHRETNALYAAMAHWLIVQPRPLILIDWSELRADKRWHLLRAGIAVGGRTLTVLEEIYPESMKGSPRAERQFLKRLHALVPQHVTPIIVTDAGFRAPWFRGVAKLGWHYVGRLRHRTRIRLNRSTDWFDNRELYAEAVVKPHRFCAVSIVESEPWLCDLVLHRRPPQGRYRLTHQGMRSRSRRSVKAEPREKDPWLLVTSPSLNELTARQIVHIYAKRMQIEQSFRDLKCERFGCAFKYSLTRHANRLSVLLLIHALATFLAWLSAMSLHARAAVTYGGIISKRPRLHYSLLRLGWEALRRSDHDCTPRSLCAAYFQPPSWFLQNLSVPA